MALEPLLVIAASGLARETIAAVRAGDRYQIRGVLDDNATLEGSTVSGATVLGPIDAARDYPEALLCVCIGSGASRKRVVERLAALDVSSARYATVLHPTANRARSCRVGAGSILLANVVMTADVTVGSHVVAMPNVTLTHDDVIDDFATLCAGVSLGGGVRIGRGAFIGMNASVRQHVSVGAGSVVGMGSVVLDGVRPGATVGGTPAGELSARAHSAARPRDLLLAQPVTGQRLR